MSERLIQCPDCPRKVRPCNLERHQRQHEPQAEIYHLGFTKFGPPKIPITLGRERDRRYDEYVPRGIGPYRYRIYRLRGGELGLLGAAPDPMAWGLAVTTWHVEGEFVVDDATGVLDTAEDPGDWVINPWALGRRQPEAVAA
jgi:hypothetical protein